MSLTSLFNFNYLKENLKKSRSIVLLCIFLVPIINLIIYLMMVTQGNSFIPSFMELSRFLLAGMYILPFILSLTLFSFVYKRQSSDFVMSMPISKRQIFITNTFGGIIIILFMLFINSLLIGFVSFIFPNVYMDYKILFDLFWIWTISYIFVFTCSNMAMSVSGNRITTFVVFLLVLFLIPFIHTFAFSSSFRKGVDTKVICDKEECTPEYYYCNDIKCEIQKKNGIYDVHYKKIDNDNYTLPYEFVKLALFSDGNFSVNLSILKMSILSILYIIVGTILFNRRKFEISNTSFMSENVHLLVKNLTLVPFICIGYSILNISLKSYDLFTILLLFVILVAYLIIYDLITIRKISKIWKSTLYFVITVLIVSFIGLIMDNKDITLKERDIKYVSIASLGDDGYVISKGKASDRALIDYVMAIFLDNNSLDDNVNYRSLSVDIYTKGKGKYNFEIQVNDEQYEHIMKEVNADDNYKKTSKYINKKNVFAISLYDNVLYLNSSNLLYKELVSKLDEDYKGSVPSSIFNVSMFVYDDYEIKEISINIEDDKELCEKVLNLFNSETKKATSKDNFVIDYYFVSGKVYYIYNRSDEYYKLSEFVTLNASDKVSIDSDYMVIRLRNYSDNDNYVFVTNKVEELNEIIKNLGDDDEESTY